MRVKSGAAQLHNGANFRSAECLKTKTERNSGVQCEFIPKWSEFQVYGALRSQSGATFKRAERKEIKLASSMKYAFYELNMKYALNPVMKRGGFSFQMYCRYFVIFVQR